MKLTLAILLIACLAPDEWRLDRFASSTTNSVAFGAAIRRAYYELVPETIPLPTGGTQKLISMRRMTSSGTTFTNHPVVLMLRCTPPFNVEVSTNLVSWEFYDQSTNTIYALEVCATQQVTYPNAFFRAKPMPPLTRTMRGF